MDAQYFTSVTMFERSGKGLTPLWLQDGDLSQNSKSSRDAMARCHSPRSPDLNPIENIFHIVSRKSAENNL